MLTLYLSVFATWAAEVVVSSDGSLQPAGSGAYETVYRPAEDSNLCRLRVKPGDDVEFEFNYTLPGQPDFVVDTSLVSALEKVSAGKHTHSMLSSGMRDLAHTAGMCLTEVRRATVPASLIQPGRPFTSKVSSKGEYTVELHAPLVLEYRVHSINLWDGTRHTPPRPFDMEGLRALPMPMTHECLWADDKSTKTAREQHYAVDCNVAMFGKQTGNLEKLDLAIPSHLTDGATEHGCNKGSWTCGASGCANKVLLVRRGSCAFHEKFEAAKARGVAALLVVDTEDASEGTPLLTLTRGEKDEAKDTEEDADGNPLVVSISKEQGDAIIKMVQYQTANKVPASKAASFTINVPTEHRDLLQAHAAKKALFGMHDAGMTCGAVPRTLLNFAIALAKMKQYDPATQAFQLWQATAEACADEPDDAAEEGQGSSGAKLTTTERIAALNMLVGLYAEWGHLVPAIETTERIRALDPLAKIPYETRFRCETTKGDFDLTTFRLLAPYGHDNFVTLIQGDYYRDSAVYRVKDDLVQWGFASTSRKQAQHVRKYKPIDDDYSVETPMDRGVLSFFGNGAHSRHTSVFVAKQYMPPEMTPDLLNIGKDQWMRGFGKVTKGMEVVDALYGGYGEVEQEGKTGPQGPNMLELQLRGNEYTEKEFPKLDYIKTCYEVYFDGSTTKDEKKRDLYIVNMGGVSGGAGVAM